jgi:hypothetical protein
MREHDATLRILRLERLTNSVNGNPRYDVIFTDGQIVRTSSDAGFCYAISNPEFRDGHVRVWFTRAGRIEHMEPAPDTLADDIMNLLDDPKLVAESAYRAIYDDLRDAVDSTDDETYLVALIVAELENFERWAQEIKTRIAQHFLADKD